MTYANDRTATDLEYAEALDIMERQRLASVILNEIANQECQEWLNWMDKRHMSDWTDEEMARYSKLTGQDVPAPAEDEQATNEGGGKVASARPTRMTCCEWMRRTNELPN